MSVEEDMLRSIKPAKQFDSSIKLFQVKTLGSRDSHLSRQPVRLRQYKSVNDLATVISGKIENPSSNPLPSLNFQQHQNKVAVQNYPNQQ